MVDGLDKQKVLIVDDAPESIQILMEALKDDYAITGSHKCRKGAQIGRGR